MKDKFLKIDFHTHILPEELPDFEKLFGYGGWITYQQNQQDKSKLDMMKNGKHFRTIECNCYNTAKRIEECNNTAVDIQVLSTVPVMFSYDAKPSDALVVAQYLNDHISNCVKKDPTRFAGLGSVPMQDIDLAVKELKRCVVELGLAGIQIGSHVNELNLDAPEFDALWATAESLGAVIFVHPWDMQMDGRMSKFWFPWLVGMPTETTMAAASMVLCGVFERYPNLKVVFAHGGGSFLATLGRISHGYQCRPDLVATNAKAPPESFLKHIIVDSLVHDEDALKLAVSKVGAENIVLGTDYPFPLGELEPGKLVEDCDWLSDHQKRLILGLNAARLLHLDVDKLSQ
ncbi:hypothetical protein BB560_003178 [Smittium megazygosporum]|uniref:2-amino-3-carboxymuconate-6-semialdehyde decarboxylase n=1 Tax=Smittium megazygosporum TaxID=133381 RepID=A0A2T9ZCQ1_9FUNG|nr:hypothetical protein BB560_005751 [Smittium megazygosporum]PVV02361.1 hypothetical protein BB560_003178 [Smittium megazygosporum]